MVTINYTLGAKSPLFFEEWNQPYIRYGAVNTAEEKGDLAQEHIWSFWLCQKAERCGV